MMAGFSGSVVSMTAKMGWVRSGAAGDVNAITVGADRHPERAEADLDGNGGVGIGVDHRHGAAVAAADAGDVDVGAVGTGRYPLRAGADRDEVAELPVVADVGVVADHRHVVAVEVGDVDSAGGLGDHRQRDRALASDLHEVDDVVVVGIAGSGVCVDHRHGVVAFIGDEGAGAVVVERHPSGLRADWDRVADHVAGFGVDHRHDVGACDVRAGAVRADRQPVRVGHLDLGRGPKL